MAKLKTNKSAAKRFKPNAAGKLKRRAAFRRHNLGKRAPKGKMELRGPQYVSEADQTNIERLLGII